MKIYVVKDYDAVSKQAAEIISDQIKEKQNSVLGLATGSSTARPVPRHQDAVPVPTLCIDERDCSSNPKCSHRGRHSPPSSPRPETAR